MIYLGVDIAKNTHVAAAMTAGLLNTGEDTGGGA